MFSLVILLSVFIESCKSKERVLMATAKANEKARAEGEIWHKQKEAELKSREDELRKIDREENARLAEINQSAHKAILKRYFDEVAGSVNIASANNSITDALTIFASADTPVLILNRKHGARNAYDQTRTITIKAYLNLLKNQRKSSYGIEHLMINDSGSITEVELKKNN